MPGPGKTLRQLAKNVGHGVGGLIPNRESNQGVGIKGIASPLYFIPYFPWLKLTQWPLCVWLRMICGIQFFQHAKTLRKWLQSLSQKNETHTRLNFVSISNFKFQERPSTFWSIVFLRWIDIIYIDLFYIPAVKNFCVSTHLLLHFLSSPIWPMTLMMTGFKSFCKCVRFHGQNL